MDENRNEIILEEIMVEYGNDLVRLAFNYVKDKETAKDVVQNSFIKCYKNLDDFRNESSLKTWLYRITINESKDYLRSWHHRKVQAKSFVQETAKSILPSAEDKVIKESENQEIRQLIFSLPKSYREVIFLYYYKSLIMDEIVEVTGLNISTVKTRLRRGKQKLKIMMEEASIYEE
ncbi:RNA polymerase, sigma subunit, SigV [Virgibacillus subterraneus]|uniref:RNA polymerase, sigma subunit, SigV n=2 Tax=Virgibacillus TaxID=84406 RepID=A0A1H1DQL1_9BACI|nr:MULTISPECIES: sigma-70 family RNA polymerase sigma factor [Virgibacillus]SDQ78772.1 RNA polymerase, sigma subunit, SigV [Virgibacillus salinus]SEQ89994.1 RNA polymerase, sigma subunit, SigV [Virgibacillus subterraneus]